MEEATVVVREAVAADARGLAEVHVRTWRVAYAGLLPQATLDRLDVDARAERWRGILSGEGIGGEARAGRRAAARGRPAGTTWVAVRGSRVLGFASSGPSREEDAPTARELYALYLDPDHHGSGIADALIDVAIEAEPAYLWVLEGNARAIRFYERQGFDLDGVVKHDVTADGTPLRERRMVRL
jgi:GNAT superfamily N-acetyltransferase